MTLTAQYRGWCENCDAPITPGETLIRVPDEFGRYTHASCEPPADDGQPVVCPKCWLTACDCGRDT